MRMFAKCECRFFECGFCNVLCSLVLFTKMHRRMAKCGVLRMNDRACWVLLRVELVCNYGVDSRVVASLGSLRAGQPEFAGWSFTGSIACRGGVGVDLDFGLI